MGGAMLSRWRDLRLFDEVCIVDPVAGEAASLNDIPKNFSPDVIVFAVKPQTLPDILANYKAYAEKGALVLSIAAGRDIAFFEKHLGQTSAIIRCMPNTPAAIGQGMSVAVANAHISETQKDLAEKMLKAVGEAVWITDESLMHAVTALSGSGPAYVFLLIEAMAAAGENLGLPAAIASQLARQTVIGSAGLAAESGNVDAAELRKNVTSPGGTTAAALDILMSGNDSMAALMRKALRAAKDRSEALAK